MVVVCWVSAEYCEMVSAIVQTSTFVTLLGAGDATIAQIRAAMELAPILVAADGGANTAIRNGLIPDAVIGDFDSIAEDVSRRIPADRQHRISEQDTTDFDKALRSVDTPLSIGVGFTGARLDHTLAALTVLARHPSRRCLLTSDQDVVVLLPPHIEISLAQGTRVSLFPLGPARISSTGLKWATDGMDFSPSGTIGTSNEALGGPIALLTSAPVILLVLPIAETVCLLDALSLSPTWLD